VEAIRRSSAWISRTPRTRYSAAVGFVPTQIDYADYRDVAGVKVPFRKTVSQTYMQMTVELSDLRPNVAIDRSRFAQPAPVPTP